MEQFEEGFYYSLSALDEPGKDVSKMDLNYLSNALRKMHSQEVTKATPTMQQRITHNVITLQTELDKRNNQNG